MGKTFKTRTLFEKRIKGVRKISTKAYDEELSIDSLTKQKKRKLNKLDYLNIL